MSIARQIENCRKHLKAGNAHAYAAGMSAGIRAALSAKASNAFRKAISEDKTEGLFINLSTDCPLARQ